MKSVRDDPPNQRCRYAYSVESRNSEHGVCRPVLVAVRLEKVELNEGTNGAKRNADRKGGIDPAQTSVGSITVGQAMEMQPSSEFYFKAL